MVAAHGELDAANSAQFVDFALHDASRTDHLVLDLTQVDSFGTAGFSAVHKLNVRCAREAIAWAVVPSGAVTRLLRICDPDSTLPVCDSLDAALGGLAGEQRRLLKLVSESG